MKLKTNLRLFLAKRDLTAAQLSRATLVPKATVSDWLAGASPKNLSQLKKVADYLSCSVDDLCFGNPEKPVQIEHLQDQINLGNFEVVLRKIK